MRNSTLYWVALVLLVVGGLNWLLVGAFNFDLVATIFGEMTAASRVIYVLVGLSAVAVLVSSLRHNMLHDHRDVATNVR